ncbi:hypothetical protein Pcinc_020033 [Petrolisthes cinctipes]|uniref:Uncharacterized protein n=1 Tax=Petrolisthes cinctipes TaxID=88211 RepID=A0AAE1FKZ4_PETCI|nr:hypothetical protein Pcinc_020033 [Petrolisthes cinctipes]
MSEKTQQEWINGDNLRSRHVTEKPKMCTDKKERGVKHMILAPPSDLRLLLALFLHHHYQSPPPPSS